MTDPLDIIVPLVFLFFGYMTGRVVGKLQATRRGDDSVLLIKPPRRYVDPDGRSDFRPEFRAAADAARQAALRELRGEHRER